MQSKRFWELKHVNIRFLWIQDAVAKKKVTLKREPSISNVADWVQSTSPRNGLRLFAKRWTWRQSVTETV